ncbi:YEATS domain-containing protein 2-like [Salmo trutta]|uniref:YEATS domain-containing protein 2-like n=1 Tax=Salmo trutta TaxID=8032 RepID=UPI0011316168|nr:YEATS domain-containing protein 2-like [Salmo trutta]
MVSTVTAAQQFGRSEGKSLDLHDATETDRRGHLGGGHNQQGSALQVLGTPVGSALQVLGTPVGSALQVLGTPVGSALQVLGAPVGSALQVLGTPVGSALQVLGTPVGSALQAAVKLVAISIGQILDLQVMATLQLPVNNLANLLAGTKLYVTTNSKNPSGKLLISQGDILLAFN